MSTAAWASGASSAAPDHIVLSPASSTITPDGSQSYTVEAFDAENNSLGDVTDSSSLSITPNDGVGGNDWMCDNTSHTCYAGQVDTYTVTAWDGQAVATATLQVVPGQLSGLELSPSVSAISTGSQTYTVTGQDSAGDNLGDVTAETNLSISPVNGPANTGAFCDDETHSCTATQPGLYTVTATDGSATGSAQLQFGTDHMEITGNASSITAGDITTFSLEADVHGVGIDVPATFTISPNGPGTGASCYPNPETASMGDYSIVDCTATEAGIYTVSTSYNGFTAQATLTVNPKFHRSSGAGTAVSVGRNGSAWVLGTTPNSGNYPTYHWNGKTWASIPGAASEISVDPSGNPWVTNSSHHISHWNGKTWAGAPGAASDVGVGANGRVWALGTNPVGGGHGIYFWNGSGWTAVPGGAVSIAVAPSGNPWITNSTHQIFTS